MGKNEQLNKRHGNPNDELYTQYDDVDAELKHYINHFRNKNIYLPFDTTDSAFYKWFVTNKELCGYNSIIVTHIKNGVDFFSDDAGRLLSSSDVVVSNPPFSKLRAIIDRIERHGLDFILMTPIVLPVSKWFLNGYLQGRYYIGHNCKSFAFTDPDGNTKHAPSTFWSTFKTERKPAQILFDGGADSVKRYDGSDVLKVLDSHHLPDVDAPFAFSVNSIPLVESSGQFYPIGKIVGRIDGRIQFARIIYKRKNF